MDRIRITAMNWWNKLDLATRHNNTLLYFPERHHSTLTGREIETIWIMFNTIKTKEI